MERFGYWGCYKTDPLKFPSPSSREAFIFFPHACNQCNIFPNPIALANPMTPVIEAFRFAFLGAGTVDINHLLYSFGFMLVVVILGSIIFNRVEQTFMDTV